MISLGRCQAFFLRHGYRYQGGSAGSPENFWGYLRELVLPHPAMKVILDEYLMAVTARGSAL